MTQTILFAETIIGIFVIVTSVIVSAAYTKFKVDSNSKELDRINILLQTKASKTYVDSIKSESDLHIRDGQEVLQRLTRIETILDKMNGGKH